MATRSAIIPASDEGRRLLPPGIAEGEAGHAPAELREYDAVPELAAAHHLEPGRRRVRRHGVADLAEP